MRTTKFLFALFLFITINVTVFAQMNLNETGFWTFGTETEWSRQNLDKAFAVFIRLKETYGEQFNLVVQDLHKEGKPSSDGSKTALIQVKIYISPPSKEIEKELQSVGLKYVK